MNALQVNESSGFLESRSQFHNTFDSTKKLKVIELVNQFAQSGKWPRLSTIAKLADCGAQTIRDHLRDDPEFKIQFEEAMAHVEDNLVDNLMEQGKNANGVTANIFLLKTRWPDRWGDKNPNLSVDFGIIKQLNESKGFIDAEIVAKPGIISTPTQTGEPTRDK
jgi:hypothetical protein